MKDESSYEKKTRPLEFLRLTTLSPKPHMHPEIEMVICTEGRVNAYINGVCHELNSGQLIIVFPHRMHFYDVLKEGDYSLFIFYPDITPRIKDIFSSSLPLDPTASVTEFTSQILEELTARYDCGDAWSSTLLTGYINLMMTDILEQLKFRSITGERSLAESIMKYCADNFKEDITLDKLSVNFNISRSSISHIFNSATGLSLPYYVNQLRISTACRLLATTSNTVTEIATEVGFSTLRNFNRVFTAMMQLTPTEYRAINAVKHIK